MEGHLREYIASRMQGCCGFLIPELIDVSEGKGPAEFTHQLLHFPKHIMTSTEWSTSNGGTSHSEEKTGFEDVGSGRFGFPLPKPLVLHLHVRTPALSHRTVNTQVCKGPPPTLALKVPARK